MRRIRNFSTTRALAALGCTCVALACLAPVAQAAPKSVSAFFGNSTGLGSTLPGQFGASSPLGVAVNSNPGLPNYGDVYVVDTDNDRIQRFNSLGQFELTWGRDVIRSGAEVNADLGNVYEICTHALDCKDGVGGGLGGEFSTPRAIAVDQASGDVYVAERGAGAAARVQAFSPDGEFIWAAGKDVIQAGGPGDVPTPPTIVNERQVVGLVGPFSLGCFCSQPITGGSFTLSLGGQVTGAIPYNATAADVKTAVEGLANVDTVTVTGGPGPNNAWTVEFTGTSGGTNHSQMVVDAAGLVPAGAFGSVSTQQNGSTTFGGPAEVCTVAATCKAASAGTKGGELGEDGPLTSSDGGNGLAVVPVGPLTTTPPFNNGGNVVVTDRGNRRVQELSPTGGFVRTFGWDVTTDGSPSDPSSVGTFQICAVATDCKQGATAGTDAGRFANNTPNRVAVDSTGAIYTVENSGNFRLQKFTPQVGPPELDPAIVNPDVGGTGPALPLTGTPTAAPVSSALNNTPLDVAIGSSDHVFVLKAFPAGIGTPSANVNERRVVELDSTGGLVDTHAARGGLPSTLYLAVRPDNDDVYMTVNSSPPNPGVYILDELAPPTASLGIGAVSSHTAQLDGLVDPNSPATPIGVKSRYRFEYREIGAPTWTAVSSDRDAGTGFTAVPVTALLDDLEAHTNYEARLVAWRPFSGVPDTVTPAEPFTTPPSRPDVDAVFVTDRASTTSTLNARINPNGVSTSYRFEYGTTAGYGNVVPVPDGDAGVAASSSIFSESLTGLEPETTYHYRVTATSTNGTSTSLDRTFTTRPVGPTPPGRAYELVSPADKLGGSGVGPWYAGIGAHGNVGIPAYDGDRYASQSHYGASLADGGFSYGSDWTLGERTSAGWVNRPAFNRPGGFGTAEFAKIVTTDGASDDLSLIAWTGGGSQMSIFPEQPVTFGDDLGQTGGAALREWDSGRWEIVAPWAAGQQSGSVFGMLTRVAPGAGYALIGGGFKGVAGPGDPTADPCTMSCVGNVYIDDVTAGLSDTFPGAGIRSLVNVCAGVGTARTLIPSVDPDGGLQAAECPPAPPGRDARPISPGGASLAASAFAPGHISDDGSRVFFMSPSHLFSSNIVPCAGTGTIGTKCPPQVYVRQRNGDGTVTTRWISRSAVGGQDASLLATAVFEGATPNGDKVFFRTASPLTPDDPNGGVQVPGGVRTGTPDSGSVDLYMYDFPDGPGADPGSGTLTRISAGPTSAGDGNVVTGNVDGAASALRAFGDDGSRVYFVTAARLPGVSAPADGTITQPGGTTSQNTLKNLYVYDAGLPQDQRWRFVARLPATTNFGDCATTGSLTGKETLQAGGNGSGLNGAVKVDGGASCVRATADGSFITFFTDGRLTVDDPVSPATGDVYGYDALSHELTRLSAPEDGAPGDSYVCVSEAPAAGTACHGDPRLSGLGNRRPPLSAIGGATDPAARSVFFQSASQLVPQDQNDVYDVYQWRDGRLTLLSTGAAGAEPALYQGNDRTGRNVYISTRDRLVPWQDHDAVLDIYAVRLGGGIPQPEEPPVCALIADNCQGGGADPAPISPPLTPGPSEGNAGETTRKTLSVASPSPAARRAATRSGVLRLAVRLGGAGQVDVVAKSRIGKRSRTIARKSAHVEAGARTTLELRLSRAARRRLASGKALSVTLRVGAVGARTRTMTVRLPGVQS